jgi:hypothetical protein
MRLSTFILMGRVWIVAAAVLACGCIPKSERPAERRPTEQTSSSRAVLQCHAELRDEEVKFKVLPDRTFGGGCTALGSLQLLDAGTPTANLGAMTCPLARQFARWTREAVQPAAEQWFDQKVVRIESFGTYACRAVNGIPGGRLSEHGRANAVDVAAFVLADGRRVTVREGWTGEDEDARRFLRAIHQAGCRRFTVGIGPGANAQHHDHFHFDMGEGRYCR